MHAHTHTHAHTCMHARTHTHTYTHTCMHACTHTHTHTHACTHAHTHAQAHTAALLLCTAAAIPSVHLTGVLHTLNHVWLVLWRRQACVEAQTDRQTDRQTQTDTQTDRHAHYLVCVYRVNINATTPTWGWYCSWLCLLHSNWYPISHFLSSHTLTSLPSLRFSLLSYSNQ